METKPRGADALLFAHKRCRLTHSKFADGDRLIRLRKGTTVVSNPPHSSVRL
jgi:hypothetical protein